MQAKQTTAQGVAAQQKQASILDTVTTDFKSDREKKEFGDALSKATPEQFMQARTLGMCAGDAAAADYLGRLYTQYVTAMKPDIAAAAARQKAKDIDPDALRNKLQGVVNKQIVGVVKSSMSKVRKRTTQFTLQQKLFEPWTDPNMPLSDAQVQQLKDIKGGVSLGSKRQSMMTEQDGNHAMMKRFLDKLAGTSEYGALATEYRAILDEYDTLTKGDTTVQTYTNGYPSPIIKELDREITSAQSDLDSAIKWGKSAEVQARIQKRIQEAKDRRAKFSTQEEIDGLDRAAQLRKQMFDPKFTDLNVNLWHAKAMAAQIAFQYRTQRDFVAEYPVLSKADIDKLEVGDQDALTNLALQAGMFKPSLTKNGDTADQAIMDKFAERQAFLDAYGQVDSSVNLMGQYTEDNEVKCKVSSAPAAVVKKITDDIARDWDHTTHGRMKYRIKGVYEVSGLALEKDFQAIKQKSAKYAGRKVGGKDCGGDLFYHGTGAMATSLILGHSGAFKVVKAKVGRMLGDGIYLADKSSKSAQYISDAGYSRSGIKGSLMVVEAVTGDTLSQRTSQGYNHDTVFAGTQHGLRNSEWCVHDPNAVIPRYLVEMEVL